MIFKQGAKIWNKWRATNPRISPNLSATELLLTDLGNVDFQGINLSGANLQSADLVGINLQQANLGKADLRGAFLWR